MPEYYEEYCRYAATSDADYLVMDLYDFDNSFIIYGNTAFGTQAGEFLGTELFKKYSSSMALGCFFEMPEQVYYPYVDLFFEKISKKYDANHIILNRFRANTYFLHINGEIVLVPEESKMLFQCKDKYNEKRKQLEDYIIKNIIHMSLIYPNFLWEMQICGLII